MRCTVKIFGYRYTELQRKERNNWSLPSKQIFCKVKLYLLRISFALHLKGGASAVRAWKHNQTGYFNFQNKKKGKDDIEHHQLLSKGPHGGGGRIVWDSFCRVKVISSNSESNWHAPPPPNDANETLSWQLLPSKILLEESKRNSSILEEVGCRRQIPQIHFQFLFSNCKSKEFRRVKGNTHGLSSISRYFSRFPRKKTSATEIRKTRNKE